MNKEQTDNEQDTIIKDLNDYIYDLKRDREALEVEVDDLKKENKKLKDSNNIAISLLGADFETCNIRIEKDKEIEDLKALNKAYLETLKTSIIANFSK